MSSLLNNPLDRNHDGKVGLGDLAPNAGANAGVNAGANTGLNQGAHANPLDRNHDGRVNLQDLSANSGLNQGQGLNQAHGLNQGAAAHANPLDRNHDGRVNLQDLSANSGLNQGHGLNQGAAHHNPLDRNHDGRVNMQDLHANSGLNQGAYVQSSNRASIGLVRAEPTVIETIQKEVVVHERIHPVQKEEIQPIIYREREQLDVKQVTQMMHETQIQPTLVQQRELPAERRDVVVERSAPIAENYVAPSREVDATLRSQVVHAPIVNEIIKKTVIEEIQPVLERDIIQSTVIQNTQPIYEKIVEAPQVYRETIITTQDRGIVGGSLEALAAQGFNIGSFATSNSSFTTTGMAQGAHHNPLDRNHDGRVDFADVRGGAGTTTTAHHNPLDRNHDGRVDLGDLRGGATTTTTTTSTGFVNASGNRRSLAEALPASYSHLSSGNMSADAKLAQEEMLRQQHANASLGAKTVL